MGIKSIISTVAFAGAFTLSTGLTMLWPNNHQMTPTYNPQPHSRKCSSRATFGDFDAAQQRRISQFIQHDVANSKLYPGSMTPLSESDFETWEDFPVAGVNAINDYVESAGRLDDSQLPSDFRAAWQAHLKAWQQQSQWLNRLQLRHETNAGDFQVYRDQDAVIDTTWREVERIAARYKATFTR